MQPSPPDLAVGADHREHRRPAPELSKADWVGELSEYWYTACAASRLGSEPKAVRVLDKNLVLFRQADGDPAALLDRCCHRGVQLSLGRTHGCEIACHYHGWRFDKDGACTHIPSLTGERRIPKGFGVPAFPCTEQDGYIWVWMGRGSPQPSLPRPIDRWQGSSWKLGSITYQADMVRLIENQFDECHPAFVHVDTHPAYFISNAVGPRAQDIETRVTDTGLVFFTPAVKETDPVPEQPFNKIEWVLPNRIKAAQKLGPIQLTVVLHFVPIGPRTTRMEFAYRVGSGSEILWTDDINILNEQDRVVESAQDWYDQGTDWERSVEADYPALLARQIYRIARAGEWEEKRSSLTQRRAIRVRV